MLSEIINQHYKDSTGGQLHQSKAKTKEFFTLIEAATMCLNEGIKDITTYQKKKSMVNRLISESKAVYNNDRNRRKKLLNDNPKNERENKVTYMMHLMKSYRNKIGIEGDDKSTTVRIRKQVSK